MSQTPITVTYSLEEILGEIKQSLNRIDERLNKIEVEVAEIKTEVKGINKRLDGQEFINRSIAVGILLTFATGIVKLFFPGFPNLPHPKP